MVHSVMDAVQESGLVQAMEMPLASGEWMGMGQPQIQVLRQIFCEWRGPQQTQDFPPEFWKWVERVESLQNATGQQMERVLGVLRNHEMGIRT